MDDLWRRPTGARRRASSWDRTGGNHDHLRLAPGETAVLMDVSGTSGCIRRMWFTIATDAADYLRATTLSMAFDGLPCAVDVPFGMFTATGSWRVNDVVSAAANVMRGRPGNRDDDGVGRGSFNVHWRMPFRRSARLSVTNGTQAEMVLFFHVEWIEEPIPEDALLFHATHRFEHFTTPAATDERQARPEDETATGGKAEPKNLSDANNYAFAHVDDHVGQYAGAVLAVESHPTARGSGTKATTCS